MDFGLAIEILLKVIGGLGVFLLGMKHLSEGMQAVAGNRLRQLIGIVTENRIMAVGVGTLVTCLVQSSSITTVMVVGFVNSGFMTLNQAIGVIFGANIGTTITGWLISLLPKIGKFGLPILGVSSFFYLFAKRDRIRNMGMVVMGIGMIFFGLDLMSGGLKPIRSNEDYQAFFSLFQATSYLGVLKCALVGCIVTTIVQSSSATLGITMALLLQGTINFESAAALVLGENIGTTITAYLASIGANPTAKRAAYAHIIFNVIGVIWATAVFRSVLLPISYRFMGADPSIEMQLTGVAMVHSCFNITNTLVFLPFMGLLAKLVTRIVPQRGAKEAKHLAHLDVRMLSSPVLGVEQSRKEVLVMSDAVEKMLGYLRDNVEGEKWSASLEEKTFRREEILDNIQTEVTEFLSQLLTGRIPRIVAEEAGAQLRMADEFESASDEIVVILKLYLKAEKNGLTISAEGREDISGLHEQVTEYARMLSQAVDNYDGNILAHANTKSLQVTRAMKSARRKHLGRIAEDHVAPMQSLIFTDILSAYRRINDHMLNVAEAIAGEK
jgi:phosphate:Na+ symporter